MAFEKISGFSANGSFRYDALKQNVCLQRQLCAGNDQEVHLRQGLKMGSLKTFWPINALVAFGP